MRALFILIACGSLALAQSWKSDLMGLPEHPTAQNSGDVDRFVQNVQLAAPYFASITPGDFEANREMVRRMWAYTMALEMIAKQNPMLRPAAAKARRAMNAFPIGYNLMPVQPVQTSPKQQPAPAAAIKPDEPPFPMQAPANAPEELASRYDSIAARASVVWQSADKLRNDLESRGMTLNAMTAAAVGRLEADMDAAIRNLRSKNFAEANAALDRADAEIAKISKAIGH